MIVELRIVFPHPGIPYNQRNDAGVVFQSAKTLLPTNQLPVLGWRSFCALLWFNDTSGDASHRQIFSSTSYERLIPTERGKFLLSDQCAVE